MSPKAFLLLAALAIVPTSCTIYTMETGAVASDGSVYLGWSLYSGKSADREEFPIGQKHGPFSSIRLHTDKAIALSEITVIYADGQRFAAPPPKTMADGEWTAPIALPTAAPLHSIVVAGKSQSKHLAKLEIYGTR
jgi:hypothetical protein